MILALFLHMCWGSFVNRQASQSMHWQWVREGKWRGSGLSQVGLGSSQAMKVHLTVEQSPVPFFWVLALWQKYISTGSL